MDKLPILQKIIILIITGIIWYSYLNVPHEIVMENKEDIIFISLWRTIVVPVVEIKSINMRLWNGGFVTIVAQNARINIFRSMTGLNDLIDKIKSINAVADYRGNL
jgi:hypothetical protein